MGTAACPSFAAFVPRVWPLLPSFAEFLSLLVPLQRHWDLFSVSSDQDQVRDIRHYGLHDDRLFLLVITRHVFNSQRIKRPFGGKVRVSWAELAHGVERQIVATVCPTFDSAA